jgi:hypothetical protein
MALTRGLGERQEEKKTLTIYRIIEALYTKPYTFQGLWKITKIHRNTLRQRLDQLLNSNIIIKHCYAFPNYRGRYVGRDFYLLNWVKMEAKSITSRLFNKGDILLGVDSSISNLTYEINSVQIERSDREYVIIRENNLKLPHEYFSTRGFIEKVKEWKIKERQVFEQIRNCVVREGSVKQRNELIEKRESILESLVSLCTRFCANTYLERNSNLSPYDILVFFTTLSIFDYWRPYTKFYETMVRMGY